MANEIRWWVSSTNEPDKILGDFASEDLADAFAEELEDRKSADDRSNTIIRKVMEVDPESSEKELQELLFGTR